MHGECALPLDCTMLASNSLVVFTSISNVLNLKAYPEPNP